jgi:hypothetical protein
VLVPLPRAATGDSASASAFDQAIATHHCQRAMNMMGKVGTTDARRKAWMECQKGRTDAFQHANAPDSEAWVIAIADDLNDAGNAAAARAELDVFYYARGTWACGHHDPDMARAALAKQSDQSKYKQPLVHMCEAFKITLP